MARAVRWISLFRSFPHRCRRRRTAPCPWLRSLDNSSSCPRKRGDDRGGGGGRMRERREVKNTVGAVRVKFPLSLKVRKPPALPLTWYLALTTT
ncbi:hypothetical protein E2C01_033437 [Portunus trituberculatus]|uniref:Uncharacterized protein n=1 Tax=Portunus trituberculatus TaxID=210409 RepID=A0A5B7F2F7_PORTR|nr:hypothetical protein [Portunus trituberculatus]